MSTITCPYCNHRCEQQIKFQPFDGYLVKDTEGKFVSAKPEGKITCKLCLKTYLFQLRTEVVVDTAVDPFNKEN